jgi:nucleoside-diphosphate-sugar epimerase
VKVLLTGATGFVGSHLARCLVDRGDTVEALVVPEADHSALSALGGAVRIHPLDRSYAQLERIACESRCDVAIHLAAIFLAEHRPEDVGRLVESNILFGTYLAEALTRAGTLRFVNTGTSWQHYEDAPYRPVCLYAATKQAFEDLLAWYRDAAGLRVVTLKLFETYGPGDTRPKLVPLLQRLARGEEAGAAFSPGDQLLDMVHVRDVASAFRLAAERTADLPPGTAEEYAVSSGHPVPLREVVARFERILGRPLGIRWGGRPHRPREVMRPWSGGRSLPGWVPAVPLDEGLRELLRADA